jgi:anti-anti-sigma factor
VTAASALPFPAADGELSRLIGAYEWSGGPLGPPSQWPGPVRATAGIVLESPQPMLLWIGPELVVLYNDAFARLAGRAHPAALGRPGARAFSAAWPVVGPALDEVLATGTGVSVDAQPLVLARGEGAEETHWDLRHSPVRGEGGEVLAVLTITSETTARVIGERRRETLRALGDLSPVRIAPAGHAVEHVTVAALDVLARNPRDIPFAAVCRPARADARELEVVAAYGLQDGLPPLPATDGGASAPEQAWRTGERVVVRGLRERAPDALAAAHPLGPLTPDAAVVVPLGARALVLGTNPYRPLDDDQLAFLGAVENHVSTVLADAGALDDVLDTARRDGRATSDDALSTALFQERERYRTLVTQAPVGIWVADRRGTTTFVNDQIAQLWGRPAAELTGAGWADQVHPDDREAAAAGWAAAVRHGTVWDSTYRIVAADGTVREVRTSARPLRDPAGAVTGFLATTADITEERRAEQIRRDVATEHAARKASEAAAARLRAMVQGLAAIVWEADWRPGDGTGATGLRFTFVSDRAEELLGHPASRWRDDPDFWPAMIHPEDRDEALAFTGDRTAAGVDHDLTYRAVATDGRVLWLHQVVHVVTGADGTPVAAQGLTVDVTEQKRAERSAALLAETGRLVTQDGSVEDRLGDLARLVVHDLGDAGVVALVGHDGLLHGAAVDAGVHRVHAAVARALRTPGVRLPPSVAEALAPGVPVVVPVTDELLRVALAGEADATARIAHRARNALVVPLVVGGELAGVLAFVNFGAGRYYDGTELDLAAELGRRASMMLTSDRGRTRERRLQQVSSDLASAGSVLEAARLLVGRLPDFVGASGVSVYLADPERGLRLVHAVGYDPVDNGGHNGGAAPARLDDPVPITAAARTGEPVWIRDRVEWARDWPDLVERASAADRHAAAALPLAAVGRVVGAIGLSFPTERGFPAEERDFVLALVAQAAPAFERAAAADERRVIAETLQKSLLPPTLPHLDRILLASRYLPGARGSQAGGDWYDVLPLDEGRVAIAVGDVVGQGARAAAIMGQLRSALSGYLLEGHGPVQALERLDRFAGRVPGATGSTVACLVLDPGTGDLVWARAGHPPPLVAGPTGCRRLDDATGTVLGVRARPPFTAGSATIRPGDSIVLYTDGLVERRGELVDDGIERLAGIAADRHGLAPDTLTDALLTGALAGSPSNGGPDPADDVALIVARLVPPPLRLVLPAQAPVLRELRAAVLAWAEAGGVGEDAVYDLQLAVGEAAANAVEHAYRDRAPGTMSVELEQGPDGGVEAHVRDEGSWRPAPEDKGYRGRGLELIRDVSSRMRLHHGPDGTDVRFTLPATGAPAPTGPVGGRPAVPPPPGPADVRVAGGTVEIRGELDLAGVQGVREEVLASADAGGIVTVDLRATTYLASAGVALLVEADRRVRAAGGRLRVRVRSGHVVRRALALSGVDTLIDVVDTGDSGDTGDRPR